MPVVASRRPARPPVLRVRPRSSVGAQDRVTAGSAPAAYLYTPTSPTYGGVTGSAAVAGTSPRWRVRIVGLDYAAKGELVSVSNLEWTENLNAFDEARFTFSTNDPAAAQFYALSRWVEVWLDGDLKFRGAPYRATESLDAQTVTVQCFDQLHPFHRRVFGRADRLNRVTNGGFESGTTGWTAQSGASMTVETVGPINEGSQSIELTSGGYINQFFSVRHTYPPGLQLRLAADYYLQSGATLDGDIAIEVLATDPDTNDVYSSTSSTNNGTVNTQTRDGWQDVVADVLLSRSNVTYLIEVRVYAPTTGTGWADRVRSVFNDATTVPFPGADQAVVYRNIVQYGQDASEGKSPLGISTNCPATGIIIYPAYEHADHRGLMSAIDELTERPQGPDWSLVFTPGATTFTTYYPDKGDTHNEWLLEVGRNIIGGQVEIDGSQVTTSAIVIGQNGDFERDEGGYVDTSQLSGLVLEDVIHAEVGSPVRFFDQVAEEHVDKRKQITKLLRGIVVSDPDRELIHDLEAGDVLPVRLSSPLPQIDGRSNYRVVAKRVPQTADRLILDLAPVPA